MATETGLETLRKVLGEEHLLRTAARLEAALRKRAGHILVLGEEPEQASAFVDYVLKRIDASHTIEISAMRMELPEVSSPLGSAKVIALVHDAEFAGSQRLEDLRFWAEGMPAGGGKLRLLLVGSGRLEKAVAHPIARLLASRIHTRIQLTRRYLGEYTDGDQGKGSRRWSFVACAVLAFVTVACMKLSSAAQHPQVGRAKHDSVLLSAASVARLAGVTTESLLTSLSNAFDWDVTTLASAAAAAPWVPRHRIESLDSLPHSASRMFVGGREIETGGAILETLVMLEPSVRRSPCRGVDVLVGAFSDAGSADELRDLLASVYPQAAVTRFEVAGELRYGVNVGGASARVIEEEREETATS